MKTLYNLPMAEYLKLPVFRSGMARAMLDCEKRAWHESWLNKDREQDDTNVTDIGSVAHAVLLHSEEDKIAEINPDNYLSQKNEVPIGWTNKSIRAARDDARAAGRIPILTADMAAVRAMVASAQSFMGRVKSKEGGISTAFEAGHREATILCDVMGVPCAIRPDIWYDDIVIHVKTTAGSANPEAWSRTQLHGDRQYITAAFYRRVMLEALQADTAHFFLVIEQNPPHLCSLIGMDPRTMDFGHAQTGRSLEDWRMCVEKQRWDAYPTRVCYPELPPWIEARDNLEAQISTFNPDLVSQA